MIKALHRGLLLTVLLCAAAVARAQRGGGGGGGGGMQRGSGMPPFGQSGGSTFPSPTIPRPTMPGGINPGARRDVPPAPSSGTSSTNSSMRGGLQLGPPGRFWDDKGFATSIGIRKDQQKRMDAIFDSNRSTLVESYRTLQVEEKRLERITQERPLDEGRIFAGIDAVVQARGVVEKAQAHMLLQIRKEMDADQVTRMDKFREEPADVQ